MSFLDKHINENRLPVMDQQTFERITNDIGKAKFREELAEYIAKVRPPFPLKEISPDVMLQAFKSLKKQDVWQYVKPLDQITKTIFEKPLHPYTHALQSANPIPDPEREKLREQIVLKEDIPSPKNPPKGCYFHTRCKHKTDICEKEYPLLKNYGDEINNHYVACIHAEKFL